MKHRFLLPFVFVLSLTACEQNSTISNRLFYFDTTVSTYLYEGEKSYLKDIEEIYKYYDKVSDNYQTREGENVLSINDTPTAYSQEFYDLIKTSVNVANEGANYFNPLCGSLAKLWKEKLTDKTLPTEAEIEDKLNELKGSQIHFDDNNTIYKTGSAQIDLGGLVKGYVLDKVKEYLISKNEQFGMHIASKGGF